MKLALVFFMIYMNLRANLSADYATRPVSTGIF